MFVLAIVFALLLLIILAVQTRWANQFVRLYRQPSFPPSEHFPIVGLVCALRGADPFLEDCLRGLMSLEYPVHEIRIIIDSEVDPAVAVVDRVRREIAPDNVEVEILDICQDTSSLKNLALAQGIRGCSSACEAFAWLDSDTVPDRDWLKNLVAPLRDEDVGATCGIRWYSPPNASIANYVRHIWNAAAVLEMVVYEIGWGGAFAIRKSVYVECELEQKWQRALVEDTLASNEVLQRGQRVEFVAACTMPNPESASLSWCVKFVTRQLQGLRYYHGAWCRVLMFSVFLGVVLAGNLVMLPWSLATDDYPSAAVSFMALLTLGFVASWLMRRSERCVNAQLGERAVGGISPPLKLAVAAPIAGMVNLVAVARSYFLSDVTWRGVHYHIRSGTDVTRTNYAPYVPESDIDQHSL
jgi:cellulose synthase/poly-beta-1,6-N-acetylglucosamine synthase-like glycosyltransferase